MTGFQSENVGHPGGRQKDALLLPLNSHQHGALGPVLLILDVSKRSWPYGDAPPSAHVRSLRVCDGAIRRRSRIPAYPLACWASGRCSCASSRLLKRRMHFLGREHAYSRRFLTQVTLGQRRRSRPRSGPRAYSCASKSAKPSVLRARGCSTARSGGPQSAANLKASDAAARSCGSWISAAHACGRHPRPRHEQRHAGVLPS